MKKRYMGVLLGLVLLTGCQDKSVDTQDLTVQGISGQDIVVSVTDDSCVLKKTEDGFSIGHPDGKVHGGFITEIEANNAMAEHYGDPEYQNISIGENDGFSYLDSYGEDMTSGNQSSGSYHHVLELESGDYLDLICSSKDGLTAIEEALVVDAGK